ncbi:MAG: carboxylesterase/lipase family protein [Deltaproteobacteria bacterium]|nr:carboxylesterase/lipase family protein [Deltaproteobacteria bacterium]
MDNCIVETRAGNIQGYAKDGLKIFKGIPYAESPVDELRFSPSVPKKPWSGILDCTKPGPIVPQRDAPFSPKPLPLQSEEGCLNLNIWTPETDAKRRPVLFWIHGGGFSFGSGSWDDGSHLASRGDCVMVTINYRVNILGFLYIKDQMANLGQGDQIMALQWVRDNIERFGGDPDNVTIFGESAGAVAVCTLMAMPAAKGLFRRVIAESGNAHPKSYDPQAGIDGTKKIMEALGVPGNDIAALRKVPTEKIVQVAEKMELEARGEGLLFPYGIYVDGKTLPEHPLEAIRNGFAKDIDLIIGTNRDEAKLYTALMPSGQKLDEEGLLKAVLKILARYGQDANAASKMIGAYRTAREGKLPTDPQNILDAVTTDSRFRIPALLLAEAQSRHQSRVFSYLFTYQSPALGGRVGACHGLEVPFLFGSLGEKERLVFPKRSAETDILSNNMVDAWTSFARTGNPSHAGMPTWLPFDPVRRNTMILDTEIKLAEDPFGQERKAWDGIF